MPRPTHLQRAVADYSGEDNCFQMQFHCLILDMCSEMHLHHRSRHRHGLSYTHDNSLCRKEWINIIWGTLRSDTLITSLTTCATRFYMMGILCPRASVNDNRGPVCTPLFCLTTPWQKTCMVCWCPSIVVPEPPGDPCCQEDCSKRNDLILNLIFVFILFVLGN